MDNSVWINYKSGGWAGWREMKWENQDIWNNINDKPSKMKNKENFKKCLPFFFKYWQILADISTLRKAFCSLQNKHLRTTVLVEFRHVTINRKQLHELTFKTPTLSPFTSKKSNTVMSQNTKSSLQCKVLRNQKVQKVYNILISVFNLHECSVALSPQMLSFNTYHSTVLFSNNLTLFHIIT